MKECGERLLFSFFFFALFLNDFDGPDECSRNSVLSKLSLSLSLASHSHARVQHTLSPKVFPFRCPAGVLSLCLFVFSAVFFFFGLLVVCELLLCVLSPFDGPGKRFGGTPRRTFFAARAR